VPPEIYAAAKRAKPSRGTPTVNGGRDAVIVNALRKAMAHGFHLRKNEYLSRTSTCAAQIVAAEFGLSYYTVARVWGRSRRYRDVVEEIEASASRK